MAETNTNSVFDTLKMRLAELEKLQKPVEETIAALYSTSLSAAVFGAALGLVKDTLNRSKTPPFTSLTAGAISGLLTPHVIDLGGKIFNRPEVSPLWFPVAQVLLHSLIKRFLD